MKIENLKTGITIKNYKELCNLLGIEVSNGNTKKAQLKEIERYCRYSKSGNKFIIDEIYDKPLDKIDLRQNGGNTVYGDDVQKLILDLLIQSQDDEVCLPCSGLLKSLSLVNSNYSVGRRNIPKLSKLLKIEDKYVYDFYNLTHNSLRSTLETALKNLDKKSLIRWHMVRMICINIADIEINEMSEYKIENNTVVYEIREEYREATKEEDLLILETERELLLDMGFKDKREVFLKGAMERFFKKVNENLYNKANIRFYYNSYKIIFNQNYIEDELIRLQETEDVDRIKFNQTVQSKILDNAEKRYEKAKGEIEDYWGDTEIFENKNIRLRDDYIENTKKITDAVINTKTKNMKSEILNTKI